ncbi:MAG TPA: M20/M25/M40 family metallo-hydrolase [Bryobacteraceae bacterium]|jgi:hypothetical protein|nr:M20/M25/M40 family metallo-hydrolase [Bryobacteraceae bacterium]
MRSTLVLIAAVGLVAIPAAPQERVDLTVVNRIRSEEFDQSKVMDTMAWLSDRYGPRLTASPEFLEAANWAMGRLKEYGLENVKLEKWGPFGRSWSLEQASVEMLEPRYSALTAAPLAWTANTAGPVTGEAIFAPLERGRTYNFKKADEDLAKYAEKWKGKLRGKIVLISTPIELKPWTDPPFRRDTDAELAEIAKAPEPFLKMDVDPRKLEVPDDPEEARRYLRSLPDWAVDRIYERRDEYRARRSKFFETEGVAAILTADARAHGGLLFAEAGGSFHAKDPLAPPSFVVTREQYDRMVRLLEKKVPVRARVNLKAKTSDRDVDSYNVIAEIPGTTKPDEVVMLGAHFDSWHTATGATDNGAGSAVMMEVMRLLKTLDLKMDRTVRLALWGGEEQGLFGSKAYVKEHFGDPKTMHLTAAHAKLSGYFNLDNGTGKIRGVYLQGNDAMRPIFEKWLAPFKDLGVTTITIRNTGGTDHLSFNAVGLPGFQFVQDPMDYGTITHHSSMDTLDHIQPADLMQASAVIASVVYDAATRPDLLPRKALPKPVPAMEDEKPQPSE